MSGNSFGTNFRITTFGESHGGGVGVVIDGCPAGFDFPSDAIRTQLQRRRPGQSKLTTARQESDSFEILSGLDPASQKTLGTPIALLVRNKDARSDHYNDLENIYRPSHADYTYDARFGLRAVAGGGRSSARETIGRVAAGALAETLLSSTHQIEIIAWVHSIDDLECNRESIDVDTIDRQQVDQHIVRCPDLKLAQQMEERIVQARKDGDSLGGVIRAVARKVPAGWGAPVFDKLTANLAGAMMSLPATRGFEIGEGFAATRMRGSSHNDAFVLDEQSQIRTRTNHSGGIQGGISNGENIEFAVAFKPTATIFVEQDTVTRDGKATRFRPQKGRHDPCVLPRAVPMVEAMAALVLCDHMLQSQTVRYEQLVQNLVAK